jgi:hypothetical protein
MWGKRGELSPLFGRHHKEESIELMRQKAILSHTLNPRGSHSPTHCQKIAEGNYAEKNWRFGKKNINASSQYFGVAIKKCKGDRYVYWRVQFWIKGIRINVGTFHSEVEAAHAYDNYVIDHNLLNPLNFKESKKMTA